MTEAEVAKILATCAAFDLRKGDDFDVKLWHQVIGDLDFAAAQQAVLTYYKVRSERIMPADIRKVLTPDADAWMQQGCHEFKPFWRCNSSVSHEDHVWWYGSDTYHCDGRVQENWHAPGTIEH